MKSRVNAIAILIFLASRVMLTGGAAAHDPCRLSESLISGTTCKMIFYGDKAGHDYGLEALIGPLLDVFNGNKTVTHVHDFFKDKRVVGLHTAEDGHEFVEEIALLLLKLVINENKLIKSGFYSKVMDHHRQQEVRRQGRGVVDSVLKIASYIGPVTSAIKEIPGIVKSFKQGDYNPLAEDELNVYQSAHVDRTTVDDVADTVNTVGLLLAKAKVPGEEIWTHAAEIVASIGHLFA